MVSRRLAAVVGGLAVDQVLGEPTRVPHPVAVFGKVMGAIEECLYGPNEYRGAVYTGLGLAIGLSGGVAVRSTLLATSVAVAGRSLNDTARCVADSIEAGDVQGARALLPSLVGRDPNGLDETEMARAVVESVAENSVDAVIAPALWALIGGAPGALGYRAANTMDAMVGHRSPRYRRFGTAAARLDDVLNWVPARVTALLVALVRPRRALAV